MVLVVGALAACAGNDGQGASRSAADASSTSSAAAAPSFDMPRPGDCRGPITREIIEAVSDLRPTVPCEGPHGSETYFVGELPAAMATLSHPQVSELADDFPAKRQVVDECERENDRFVGVKRLAADAIRPDNLDWAFFIPSSDDWEMGARWIRCDAVTELFEGQTERSTTERMQGLAARDPLPDAFRRCYADVAAVEASGLGPCDQPHRVELMLEFRVTDPRVDALAGDPKALADYARTAYFQTCAERAAPLVGLSPTDLMTRKGLKVGTGLVEVAAWATDPTARLVWCLAITERLITGTVEGLGTKPLPFSEPG